MSAEIRKIVLVSASPKADGSTSDFLASIAEEVLKSEKNETTCIGVRQSINKKTTEADFQKMMNADALVIIFPLYFFCLPGILMRFLQDYNYYLSAHVKSDRKAQVYSVINCGFPEPWINSEAARVIESFSEHTRNSYRFSVLIGGGGMLKEAKDAPFMKKTMQKLKEAFTIIREDILSVSSQSKNINVSINFPSSLYLFMGNLGWPMMAKKNGLKKRDMYRAPYNEV